MYRVTTIITTSLTPSAPELIHLNSAFDSLKHVPELKESPIIISLDGPVRDLDINRFNQYKKNVQDFCKKHSNVNFVYSDKCVHLSGSLKNAFSLVQTPILFVQQHDLFLIQSVDLNSIINSLTNDPLVKHIRLNKRANTPSGWDKNPLFGNYNSNNLKLTRTGCWSDQNYFCTKEYFDSVVLLECKDKANFPECILNNYYTGEMDNDILVHKRLGTFIYGPTNHSAIIHHSDGRFQKQIK